MRKQPHVERRKVYRYYANGKGYASKMYAYKKLATKRLRLEVFGHDYCLLDKAVAKAIGVSEHDLDAYGTEQRNQCWDELMAERFPHSQDCFCLDTCSWGFADIESKDRTFQFKSCKYAINQWVETKARELMAEDEDA